jgi:Cation transporter/ATPase, N-terminus
VSTRTARPQTSAQASQHLQQHGPNTLPQSRTVPPWQMVLGAVTLVAHSSGGRRACRGQPQREPGRREPARSSAVLLSLGSGQLGVVEDGLGVRAHTRMPAVGRVSEPMPLALVGAGLWLVASVTIAPLRSMLSTQQLPATIRGLALRSALTGQGAHRPAPADPL